MADVKSRTEIIGEFFRYHFLLSQDAVEYLTELNILDDLSVEDFISKLKIFFPDDNFIWLNRELLSLLLDLLRKSDYKSNNVHLHVFDSKTINWNELQRARVLLEKGKKSKPYEFFLNLLKDSIEHFSRESEIIQERQNKDHELDHVVMKENAMKDFSTEQNIDSEEAVQSNQNYDDLHGKVSEVHDKGSKASFVADTDQFAHDFTVHSQGEKSFHEQISAVTEIQSQSNFDSADISDKKFLSAEESNELKNNTDMDQFKANSTSNTNALIGRSDNYVISDDNVKYDVTNVDAKNFDEKDSLNDLSLEIIDFEAIPERDFEKYKIKVLFDYEETFSNIKPEFFRDHFLKRFQKISAFLRPRPELENLTSISALKFRKNEKILSIIGMVYEVNKTSSGNIILTLEDMTGMTRVIVLKDNEELSNEASFIVEDEIIAVIGSYHGRYFLANKILFPDVPNLDLKRYDKEKYVAFVSDIHIGSNKFLPSEFEKFISWVNGKYGSEEEKAMAKNLTHIFIVGDLVDGVGIYPGQEEELFIKDIKRQYKEIAYWLKKIPENIAIIIIPGNHDAVRIAEPQPKLPKDIAFELWKMPNVFIFSNPSLVNVLADTEFSGFDVLLYHGYSFDYFVANVESIRLQGGYDRADLIMSFLLKKRHLAPTHKSSLYIPDPNDDPLVISKIPDFFVSGHIHKMNVSQYRSVTLICSSTFQAKTSFQEKVGHDPQPGYVPVVNLKTRKVHVLDFSK